MPFTGLLLDQVMDVLLATYTASAQGGQVPSYATIYATIPCRVKCLTMMEQDILARRGIEATDKVFCDADLTGLTANMELQITDFEGTMRKHIITGYHEPRGGLGVHHLELTTREVR